MGIDETVPAWAMEPVREIASADGPQECGESDFETLVFLKQALVSDDGAGQWLPELSELSRKLDISRHICTCYGEGLRGCRGDEEIGACAYRVLALLLARASLHDGNGIILLNSAFRALDCAERLGPGREDAGRAWLEEVADRVVGR